jgi:hypothetical protein
MELRAYSNVDHVSDPTYRKSVTDFYIFLGDSLISWKSNKQSVVSQSFTKAEYRSMTSATKEIIWLRWLVADMRVSLSHPTPIYCDNQSSIQIAHNSVFMNELSILRLIVILLVIISSMTPLLCLLFLLLCKLQISLPSRIPFLVFVF